MGISQQSIKLRKVARSNIFLQHAKSNQRPCNLIEQTAKLVLISLSGFYIK